MVTLSSEEDWKALIAGTMAGKNYKVLDEEALIVKVREYEDIYNTQSRYYSDREYKDNIWREIGDSLGFPDNICRAKWQTLRGSFRREHLKITPTTSAATFQKRKLWKWYQAMSFLLPYMADRQTGTDIPNMDTSRYSGDDNLSDADSLQIESDAPTSSRSSAEKCPRSRRKNKSLKKIGFSDLNKLSKRREVSEETRKTGDDSSDGLKSFFQSMFETVRNFSHEQQARVKMEIFRSVNCIEMETQSLQQQQYNSERVSYGQNVSAQFPFFTAQQSSAFPRSSYSLADITRDVKMPLDDEK